jgi:hypothetical protein
VVVHCRFKGLGSFTPAIRATRKDSERMGPHDSGKPVADVELSVDALLMLAYSAWADPKSAPDRRRGQAIRHQDQDCDLAPRKLDGRHAPSSRCRDEAPRKNRSLRVYGPHQRPQAVKLVADGRAEHFFRGQPQPSVLHSLPTMEGEKDKVDQMVFPQALKQCTAPRILEKPIRLSQVSCVRISSSAVVQRKRVVTNTRREPTSVRPLRAVYPNSGSIRAQINGPRGLRAEVR